MDTQKKKYYSEAERLNDYYLALQKKLARKEIQWAMESFNRNKEVN